MSSEEALFIARLLSATIDLEVPGVEHVETVVFAKSFPAHEGFKSIQWVYFMVEGREYDLYLAER
jgi:hypothetical protein